jgi:SAM-dependent methyltransferase
MLPYFLTAAALKAASANTLTRSAYRTAAKLKNDPPCDIFLRVALWCLDGLPASRQRLLDLGTGWIHAFALFAALLRHDDELHCFDVADIRKWKCFQATLPLIFDQLPGQVPEDVLRKATRRVDLIKRAKSFEEVYQILGMIYQWRQDGLPDYPDNYFDRIFSVDVLEHVDADLFPKAANVWHRILKPGGQFYAQVGIDDHLAYYQGRYGSKRYLRYSHQVWNWLLSNQVQYINRFTKTQILQLLEAKGFVIDEVETDLGGDTSPERVHPDYSWQSEEDIRAVRLYVKAHKPLTS